MLPCAVKRWQTFDAAISVANISARARFTFSCRLNGSAHLHLSGRLSHQQSVYRAERVGIPALAFGPANALDRHCLCLPGDAR
jgi:hypothetical protein